MDTKKHYKMYKDGKKWCYAAVATMSVALGVFTSTHAAEADVNTDGQPATAQVAGGATANSNNTAVTTDSANPTSDAATVSTNSASSTSETATDNQAASSSVPTWKPADAQISESQAAASANQSNQAYLDSVNDANGKLNVSGWNASNQDVNKPYHILIAFDRTTGRELDRVAVQNTQRDDVAKVHPDIFNAKYSGFSASLNLNGANAGDLIQLVSRYSDAANGEGNNVDRWFDAIVLNKKSYWVDHFTQTSNGIHVDGWMQDDASVNKPYAYLIVLRDGKEITRVHLALQNRSDVANAYGNSYNSLHSGFSTDINLDASQLNGDLRFVLRFSDAANGEGHYSDQNTKTYRTNAGYADAFSVSGNSIHYSGWHAAANAQNMKSQYIIVVDMNGRELYRTKLSGNQMNISRSDVANVYPWIANAGQSGFSVDIPLLAAINHKGIQIVHRYTNSSDGNSDYVDFWSNTQLVNSGWQGNKYYNPATGQLATGTVTIDGRTYYFDNNGNQLSRGGVALQRALSMQGVNYVWGGNTPAGFDCSGLVQWAYGLDSAHRTTYTQQSLGAHHYDVANAPAGALVFFGSDSAPYHVGISLGNGSYVHAPEPGQKVKITSQLWFKPSYYVVLN